jgi:hypothetical protein
MVVWCAGGIDGASADTMEKEGLKEGWRRLGGVFSPPLTSGLLFPGGRSEQSAVAALHQSEPSLDQAFDLIPHLVSSPIRLGNAVSGQ